MHPTLLVGPADWDAARMPREEFVARIAAMWEICEPEVACVIVFGNARHHAELAWLTHFTPKLEPALALIERNGAVRLFVAGGVNMFSAARPLTWVDQLFPLRNSRFEISESLRKSGSVGRLAMIGSDTMPSDFRRDIAGALAQDGSQVAVDITPRLAPLMDRKSACELAAVRQSCTTLNSAIAALGSAWRSGAVVTAAILAAEAAANHAGAQDVRSLFSLDGGRTLVPFTGPDNRRSDPLLAYVATRQFGYWAEGFAMFSTARFAALHAASCALRAGIAAARPGLRRRALAKLLMMQPEHPIVAHAPVASVGLSLEETWTKETDNDALAPNAVYSLRAGILGGSEAAVVSAMVAITADGAEIMWMQP